EDFQAGRNDTRLIVRAPRRFLRATPIQFPGPRLRRRARFSPLRRRDFRAPHGALRFGHGSNLPEGALRRPSCFMTQFHLPTGLAPALPVLPSVDFTPTRPPSESALHAGGPSFSDLGLVE